MIDAVGRPPKLPQASPVRSRQAGAQPGPFAVAADDVAVESAATGALAEAGSVSLGGLLAMQEAESEPPADREAKRRGEDVLGELAALQRDLLADGPSEPGLARLAALADRAGGAAGPGVDPRLRGVLDAIGVRARVELARYRLNAERSRG